MKEKTADEMMTELGYTKKIHINKQKEEIDFIGYDKRVDDIRIEDCSLIFLMNAKMITTNIVINMQELQAINKKCKELNWLGDE